MIAYVLGCYLMIGVIITLLGPFARHLKEEVYDVTLLENKKYRKLRIALYVIILWSAAILTYPIFFYQEFYTNKYRKIIKAKVPGKLYYSDTCGFGKLICKSCNMRHEFISFMHGFGENSWSTTGYQCQSCGVLCNYKRQQKNPIQVPMCHCGGKISREQIIVCPECKSDEVLYKLEYLT